MTLVLVCALPMLAASLLIVFGGQIERAAMRGVFSGGLNPPGWLWEMASRLARYSLALLTTVAVAALLYYFAPYRRQQWRFIWPGAILATFLWLLSTSGFAWYVRHMAHYNVMYGSIGAGIALLVWMYLLAAIALVGCEFNAACERSAPETGAGYHSE
jgi:membrane protein